MGKARRIHGAPVEDELAQGGKPGLRKESARTLRRKPELEQPSVEHGLYGRRDFWVPASLAAAPGAQEEAISGERVLTECRPSSRRSRSVPRD